MDIYRSLHTVDFAQRRNAFASSQAPFVLRASVTPSRRVCTTMPTRLRNAFATARLAGPLRTLCLPSRFRTRGAAYLSTRTLAPLVVVGSMNADVILEIDRFPQPGETITTPSPDTGRVVAGGKGANQAVAAARLSAGTGRRVRFVGQFGNDAHARMLESVLKAEGVDVGLCGRATDKPSGQVDALCLQNARQQCRAGVRAAHGRVHTSRFDFAGPPGRGHPPELDTQ